MWSISLAGVVSAAPPEKRANTLYNEGKQAMSRGEYREAIVKFDEALEIFDHPLILKKRAESREKLSEYEEAIADYQKYLGALRPNKRSERRMTEERISALEALLLKPVAVTIVASRVGVLVSVDGKTPRRTPFEMLLAPGKHRAQVKDPRYAEEARDVRVRSGRASIVRLEAVPRTGAVVIMTDQQRLGTTQIAIDNQPIELTPGERQAQKTSPRQLVMGPHSLVCTLPGRPSYYVEFSIEEGVDSPVMCAFETVKSADVGADPWGWVTVGAGAVSLLAGGGVMVAYSLDLARESDLNTDLDPNNDVTLETNKHLIGGALIGVGLALSIGSYFVFTRDRSGTAAGAASPGPALSVSPLRQGALLNGTWSF